MDQRQGAFIVIEGVDGAGKSTQAYLLAKHIATLKKRVVPIREPGGTALGERIREILLDPGEDRMSRECELMLYMASRAQLVDEIIRPALEKNHVVVSERYLLSSLAYQGYAAGLPMESIRRVADIAIEGIEPDLTIILDIDPELAIHREKAPGVPAEEGRYDRIEKKGLEFQKKVREGFLQMARMDTEKIKVVDASRSVKEVHEEIKRLVEGVIR